MRAVVKGIAHDVPQKILTNQDLERIVETSDEWIVQRTGIRERRVAGPGECCSTFAIGAARKVIAAKGIDPASIDLVIVATVTGDMPFPAVSCLVQQAIGATRAGAFDLGAACAGFIYALATASSMIVAGQIRNALVVGVDVLTKYVDWTDRSTCVLFGDGAGAAFLEGSATGERGLVKTALMADGSGAPYIDLEVGGTRYPFASPEAEGKRTKIFMAGNEVYRWAVSAMGDACCRVLEMADLQPEDIDLFVPHQANLRIIDSAKKRLGLPDDKVFVNVAKYGNTSAGSIPIALSEAVETGRLREGMLVMTVGFGAGLVWGANIIRW